MEKEFVTYEQALALNELGCGVIMNYKYWKIEDNIFVFHYNHNTQSIIDKGFDIECLNVYAPLKQQVFRWFREKYSKNSFIELVYQDGLKYDYVLYVDKKEEECENYGDGPYNTYEEAENACIDKLIEIAKEFKS